MGVTLSALTASIRVVEELDAGNSFTLGANGDNQITHHALLSESLSSGGPVPAAKVVASEFSLSGGALTLDFSAIAGTNGMVQDMTGLKLQQLMIRNKVGNDPMTFEIGASNGYTGLGAAFSVTLAATQFFLFSGKDLADDVASGAKTIDVSGTGTETFEIIAVFG